MSEQYMRCEKRLCKCNDAGICKGNNVGCGDKEFSKGDCIDDLLDEETGKCQCHGTDPNKPFCPFDQGICGMWAPAEWIEEQQAYSNGRE